MERLDFNLFLICFSQSLEEDKLLGMETIIVGDLFYLGFWVIFCMFLG